MKRSTLTAILIFIALFGIGLWGGMLWLTNGDSDPNELLIHLGNTGATLSVLIVLGALVRAAFNERDNTRREEEARLAFVRAVLADFKSVYDRVESCRLLVEAHRSAKTYGEQSRELVGGVVTLHNIKRALNPEYPELSKELAEPIKHMTKFIKGLLIEFRDHYKEISHLQAADEAWNKHARENLPKANKGPESYQPVSRAWSQIDKLPQLSILRDDRRFDDYEAAFLVYLDQASRTLRKRLPGGER